MTTDTISSNLEEEALSTIHNIQKALKVEIFIKMTNNTIIPNKDTHYIEEAQRASS